MPNTTACNFGDVVLVRFPFTDQIGHKQRPAVVVSSSAYQRSRADAILLAITSQIRPHLGFGEAPVADWQSAGLLKPSLFKPIVFTAEQSLLLKTLGVLSDTDQRSLHDLLQRIIG